MQEQSRTGTWVAEGWTPQPRVSELQGGGTSIPSDWGLQEDQVQQRGKARRENPEGRDRETEMEGETEMGEIETEMGRYRNGERQRQGDRDRETQRNGERQRDRETERETGRDRETGRQRWREKQRWGKTETEMGRQRHGDTETGRD